MPIFFFISYFTNTHCHTYSNIIWISERQAYDGQTKKKKIKPTKEAQLLEKVTNTVGNVIKETKQKENILSDDSVHDLNSLHKKSKIFESGGGDQSKQDVWTRDGGEVVEWWREGGKLASQGVRLDPGASAEQAEHDTQRDQGGHELQAFSSREMKTSFLSI